MEADESYYECLACRGRYCLKCNVKYHFDMSCEQYQLSTDTKLQEKVTLEEIKNSGAK